MRSPWRLLLGMLCIALVLLGGTLSVTHSHADGIVHGDCGLCITAHSVVPATVPTVHLPVARVLTTVETAVASIPFRRLSTFALFIRPPPVNAHLS
jgi:hypothetical protein